MQLDIDTLEALRRQHPAWRLLAAESAALVASFLHRVFVVPNRRVIAQADLAEALDDTLYALREQRGANQYPKPAQERGRCGWSKSASGSKRWRRQSRYRVRRVSARDGYGANHRLNRRNVRGVLPTSLAREVGGCVRAPSATPGNTHPAPPHCKVRGRCRWGLAHRSVR